MNSLFEEAQTLFPYTQSIRRDIHKHPEVGFQEFRTSGVITKELKALGLEVTSGIAKTGVMAMIEGKNPGPVVMLRFDIDALPIKEDTGAEYCSTIDGVMHACGHDGHIAIGLTVAKLLNQHRSDFNGSVKLVFQPAEEGVGGAGTMIKEGALLNPKPDHCLGLHIWNEKPLGWLGIASGPVMASAGYFTITLTGKGGHGALPHNTIDPVVAAAQIITAAQTISSRNTDPQLACVISFCKLNAGHAFNVIPQTLEMAGTIRAFEPEVEQMAYKRLNEIAKGIGEAMGCSVEIIVDDVCPAVINDPLTTSRVLTAAKNIFPSDKIDEKGKFTMGAEDFSLYHQEIPGSYFFVGSTNSEKGLVYGHHHPKFDFDEAVLPKGAALMAQAAINLLNA